MIVVVGEFARVGVDDGDELCGFLAKELVELFKMLVHLWDCLHHWALYNSN